MAAPSMTTGTAGNVRSSASLAASATANYDVDYSAVFAGIPQIGATFGTIAATAGLQIDVYRRVGTTPVTSTTPLISKILTAASGAKSTDLLLETGKYNIKITNLDATNGLTLVYITADTISGVA